ncbi:MAG: glutathione peroxidase [Anaeroplasmataceae bacterium]
MNIYDFKVKDNKGVEVQLDKYKGKVLLVINSATHCGLTPQYTGIQNLYDEYKDQGLEILDFPCNQFLNQTPEDDKGINEFCSLNFGTKFPRFKKIDVNGSSADPLFVWLKKQAPDDLGNKETMKFEEKVKAYTPNFVDGDIKWNFTKFLIDKEGNVVARYSPNFLVDDMKEQIEQLLK